MKEIKKIVTPKDRELREIADRLNEVIEKLNGIKVIKYGNSDLRLEVESDLGKIITVVDTFEFNK